MCDVISKGSPNKQSIHVNMKKTQLSVFLLRCLQGSLARVCLIRGNFLLIVLKIANHKEQKKQKKLSKLDNNNFYNATP